MAEINSVLTRPLLPPPPSDDAELAYVSERQEPAAQVSEEILQKLALEQQEQGILSRVGHDLKTFVRRGEMVTAPVHGFIKGWNEMIDTTDSFMDRLAERTGLPLNPYMQFLDKDGNVDLNLFGKRPEGATPVHIPNILPPESGTGHLASGVSQFMAGFGPAFKVLKGLNIFKSPAFTAGAAGFISDMVAFDPYEERLSSLGLEYGPEALKPVFEFLKADKENSEPLARLKSALEGVLVGGAVGGVVKLAQTMKRFLSHPKRVEGLTGQHYQADPTVLQAAQELKYWGRPPQ